MGPSQVYRTSLALLTDFYQLTMAAQLGSDGKPLFEPAFLDWLPAQRLDVDVDAVPEGTVVFPHEPLLRVRGPVVPCMLLETPLLAIVNFQTLIATKAARIVLAARGAPVVDFGLRRAQGLDGSLSAARAAYIGGVAGTSNVLAAKLYGIPVKGTHAHSWVMLFDGELDAFRAYARAMPANTVLLVDTYDTLEGVRHAITVGKELARDGHRLAGIRLDSGDLAWLSQQARGMLDEAGLRDTAILASNELDEHVIQALHDQKAAIAIWGVGRAGARQDHHPRGPAGASVPARGRIPGRRHLRRGRGDPGRTGDGRSARPHPAPGHPRGDALRGPARPGPARRGAGVAGAAARRGAGSLGGAARPIPRRGEAARTPPRLPGGAGARLLPPPRHPLRGRPEVPFTHDGRPHGGRNPALIESLLSSDALVVAGQAASHCVKATVEDLLREIQARDPRLAGRVYLLEDCMSSVAVPDGKGGFLSDFTPEAEAALGRFAEAGMNVVRSTTPIGEWPGMGMK